MSFSGAASSADDPLSDDAITADFRVLQRLRGHRYSLDDVLTAFVAARRAPAAQRILDLGSGIGSVAIMLAWTHRDASLTTVEAQEISFALQERNVERNGLRARLRPVCGDFRDPEVRARLGEGFDLVTGTPPYFSPAATLPSSDPQRAYARVERRGGVEDYLSTARALVAEGGVIVVCADAKKPARVTGQLDALGLSAEHELVVSPRAGKEPLFTVWTLRRGPALAEPRREDFVARSHDGARTEAQREIRAFFGLPMQDETPSPPERLRTGARA